MAKKTAHKKRSTTTRSTKSSSNVALLKNFKAEHGIVAGVGLMLLKGILGISVLVGLFVLVLSSIFYLKNLKKAK